MVLIAISTYDLITMWLCDYGGYFHRTASLFAGMMFLSSIFIKKIRHQIIMIASAFIILIETWSIKGILDIYGEYGSVGQLLYHTIWQLLLICLFTINIFGAKVHSSQLGYLSYSDTLLNPYAMSPELRVPGILSAART
jgi:hypothetical protein